MTGDQDIEDSGVDLKVIEEFVVNNDELLELEERIGRFNIFDSLGIVRKELQHSNFLAWLLDPAESHGQGSLFLKAILMDLLKLARDGGFETPVSPIELDGTELRGVEVRREWRRIDILIKSDEPAFVIAIENKIHAGPDNPFEDYERSVHESFGDRESMFVYLTTAGGALEGHEWVPYSYADIFRVLSRVLHTHKSAISDDVRTFLDHYLRLIRSRFMDNPEIDELCRKIYTTHRRAIDLIFEHRPDPLKELLTEVRAILQSDPHRWDVSSSGKYTMWFRPQTWLEALPAISIETSTPSPRWLGLAFEVGLDRCRAYFWVSSTSDDELRNRILTRITDDPKEFGLRFHKELSKKAKMPTLWSKTIATWKMSESPDLESVIERVSATLNDVEVRLRGIPNAIRLIVEEWKRSKEQ